MNAPIPKGLRKPPTFPDYDGTGDPKDYVESFDMKIGYQGADSSTKCKLFPIAFKKTALDWYKALPPKSIDSWEKFQELFIDHFIASRSRPKSTSTLAAIRQTKEESLRDYVDRFVSEAATVKDVSDDMQRYLFEQGLSEGTLFKQDIGIKKGKSLREILHRAEKYMIYEDDLRAEKIIKKNSTTTTPEVVYPGKKENQKEFDHPRRERIGRMTSYMPLNAPRARILEQCANAEFQDPDVRWPRPKPEDPNADRSKYCKFHKTCGHYTEQCLHLKDVIEFLARKGKLDRFLKDPPQGHRRKSRSPSRKSPSRGKQVVSKIDTDHDCEDGKDESPDTPHVVLVISGGLPPRGGGSSNSLKRAYKEAMSIAEPRPGPSFTKRKEPISFSDDDFVGGRPNAIIPLVIRAHMANFDVRRIFIDQGSSADIMYYPLFETLKMRKSDLTPYAGSDLQGFDGSTMTPMGHVDLFTTFGVFPDAKTVKVRFLVLPCSSPYNCIIGRPTIGELGAVSSTVHLKMKFHTDDGKVVTVQGDLEAARRCYLLSTKTSE